MSTPLDKKSTNAQIKERFDNDVERFSNLETGQQAVIDAPLMLDLISDLAPKIVPGARTLLDIGCGAGNNTIKILRSRPGLDCDLLDLSDRMLERAAERVRAEESGVVRTFCGDLREVDLPAGHYDLIVAAAVLHHLRDDEDWLRAFQKIHDLLAPGGALFVSDMFFHDDPQVHAAMWARYGDYLRSLGGEEYRQKVFDYIEAEDSPRGMTFQIELLRRVGFAQVDVLHKNSCFGAYVAIKPTAD